MGDGCIKVSAGANANERMTAGVVALEAVGPIISALTKLEVGH